MLHISLLGERTVVDDATGEVRSRSSRTLALIALLATHAGSPQPRSRIAGAFWPASPEGQALTNVRRELHQLRRTLAGDGSLVVTATDLMWCDTGGATVDLRVFEIARERALRAAPGRPDTTLEHGRAALAAYRGDLLPGLYDDWTLEHREALLQECVEVCALVVRAAVDTGDGNLALRTARRWVALAPLDEVGHRALIRLLAGRGDRAGAVSAYHHCATVLEEELGVEPDPATRRLLAELTARGAPTPPAVPAAVAAVDFVGRHAELAALDAAIGSAAAGSLRLALVVGEPGVGKSRLVTEAGRLARLHHATVARAHCYGAPGQLVLAPVAEWLTHPALAAGLAQLAPIWRSEVERLVPGSDTDPRSDGSRAVVDAWQRHRFFQGLARALCVPGRPLVLVLEDLQWCDRETLDFLSFLLASESRAPVLVAMTARAHELQDGPHADWVRRTRRSGRLAEVALEPFDLAETARLVGRLTGQDVTEDAARVIGSATGGFPLFVVEAARRGTQLAVDGDIPDSGDLDAVLRARFQQLDAATRRLAGLAAATGRHFDLELLCEASDLDADSVVRAVDELWRLRILTERDGSYDFSHDLLRGTAYQLVSPPGRWLLHRRLAQALELRHAGRTDEVAALLAEQYARAGNAARAVESYHRAAVVAARVFAHAEAIRLHRAALDQLAGLVPGEERDRREIRTLTALTAALNAHRGYSDPDLVVALERTVVLTDRLASRAGRTDALVGLWASHFVLGDVSRAHGLATRALALADAPGEPAGGAVSGQAHFAFAGCELTLGRPQSALEHFELACAQSSDEQSLSIGSHPAIHARAWSAHAHWLLGDHDRARAESREAVGRARATEHPYSLAIALGFAALTSQLLHEVEPIEAATHELARLGDRHGFAYYPEWGLVLGGWARDDAAGTRLMELGISHLREAGALARMPYWLSLLAQRTGADRARALLDAALVTGRTRRDRWWLPEVARQRAVRFLDGDEARTELRDALVLAQEQGSVTLADRCRRDLADPRRHRANA